nr:actin cytoskeleton-regulatory complex protein pan1-like [Aegilops tauschii subsp. strangulata]
MEEEEETNLGAGGSTPATNFGGEGATSSQPSAGASLADQENIDTVIKEVARDAEAKADKIAAEEADVEKAQEAAKGQAAKDEAAQHQDQAKLNSQEEDLVAREGELAATLSGKDEEVKKLATQWTQELEQRAREETVTKALEDERQLRRNDTADHEEYVKGENLWISRLADVAGKITTKLAAMGMPNVSSLCPSAGRLSCAAAPPPPAPRPAPAPPPAARPAPPLPSCAYAPRIPATPTTFLRRHGWGARHLLDPRRGLLPCARPERSKVGGCRSYLN